MHSPEKFNATLLKKNISLLENQFFPNDLVILIIRPTNKEGLCAPNSEILSMYIFSSARKLLYVLTS